MKLTNMSLWKLPFLKWVFPFTKFCVLIVDSESFSPLDKNHHFCTHLKFSIPFVEDLGAFYPKKAKCLISKLKCLRIHDVFLSLLLHCIRFILQIMMSCSRHDGLSIHNALLLLIHWLKHSVSPECISEHNNTTGNSCPSEISFHSFFFSPLYYPPWIKKKTSNLGCMLVQ